MDALNACGYLSRVVALPVAVAEAVFDDVTRSLGASAHAEPTALGVADTRWVDHQQVAPHTEAVHLDAGETPAIPAVEQPRPPAWQ